MSSEATAPMNDKLKQVCNYVREGKAVMKACDLSGISSKTFYEILDTSVFWENAYARAREGRADYRFETMQEVLDDIRLGMLEPNAGRVILDTMRWQCAKEKSKIYGDSTTLKGDKDNPLDIGLAALLQAAGQRREQLPAIEGEQMQEAIPAPSVSNIGTE